VTIAVRIVPRSAGIVRLSQANLRQTG
jgi:hypothetical protein